MRYILSDKQDYKLLFEFAKKNRKNLTFAEKIVWNELRRNSLGFHFRRQVVVGKYIVDFICIDRKLIIEIDGDSHIGKDDYDEERTKYFEGAGFRVIRFLNEDVIHRWNFCERQIMYNLNRPLPDPLHRRG